MVGVRRICRIVKNGFFHSPPFDGSFAFSGCDIYRVVVSAFVAEPNEGRMIDREIQLSARLPQVRSLQSRDYSRRRLGSHGWPSDEQMATISGRHVHSLYLGVPGSAVGDCEVGWEDSRFITSFAHGY